MYIQQERGAVHKVCHAPGGGSEKVRQFVTGEEGGGKDHVTSHFLFFHNSYFNVLFDILSYIVKIGLKKQTTFHQNRLRQDGHNGVKQSLKQQRRQ